MSTFYVATAAGGGNDANPGTIGSPKLTPAAGVALAFAGDTVYLRGGTYTGSSATIDSQYHTVNSGTSYANAVTISGYPGETAILQPAYGTSAVHLDATSPHYIIIQDLTFDMVNNGYSGVDCVYLYTAHHIRFQRMNLTGSAQHTAFGVHVGDDTPYIEFLHSRVHHFGNSTAGPNEDGHGFYITASDGLYEYNEVDHNSGYGFHTYNNRVPHVDPCRNVIRNNKIHDNGNLSTAIISYAIVITWGDSNQVYNNLIYDNENGIQLYTASSNTVVYNNTVYRNSHNSIDAQYLGGDATIRNNILYGNGVDTITDYGSHSAGTITADHNLTTNPSFTNAGALDFTLQGGSAALDAGLNLYSAGITTDFDGNPRPSSGPFDVGAFEDVSAYDRSPASGGVLLAGRAPSLDIIAPGFSQVGSPIEVVTSGGSSTTSAGVNTAGANFFWMAISYDGAAIVPTLSDSYGNVWRLLTAYGTSAGLGVTSRIAYAYNATGGYGHTFTFTHPGGWGGAAVIHPYRGSFVLGDPFDRENGLESPGPQTSIDLNDITPTDDHCLVAASVTNYNCDPLGTVDGGFAMAGAIAGNSGVSYGVCAADLIQSTRAAAGPVFSQDESVRWAGGVASFKSVLSAAVVNDARIVFGVAS